jgi:hypothetical protein
VFTIEEARNVFGIEKSCSTLDNLLAYHLRKGWHKKAEHLVISDKTFGNVPMTGLEPAPCCQE